MSLLQGSSISPLFSHRKFDVEELWRKVFQSRRELLAATQLLHECAKDRFAAEMELLLHHGWRVLASGLWSHPLHQQAVGFWEALKIESTNDGNEDK